MKILAIDIGGKTRNGFCLMDSETLEIIKSSYVVYDTKSTPWNHRQKILKEIKEYYLPYADAIVFERINLFRGKGVSPLANITSLCKLQTTLIDNLSQLINIYDVPVKTWKCRVLSSGNATKEDSIKFVQEHYSYIDLEIPVYSVKNPDKVIYNHDLADSICIAYAACRYPDIILKNIVNFT